MSHWSVGSCERGRGGRNALLSSASLATTSRTPHSACRLFLWRCRSHDTLTHRLHGRQVAAAVGRIAARLPSSSRSRSDGRRAAGPLRADAGWVMPPVFLETPLSWPNFASLFEGIKVDAMETSGSDDAVTYLGKAEERDGYYELEHLPPLLEDEVSQYTSIW